MRPNVKVVDMVHMLKDYPAHSRSLIKDHDYEVCTHLQIGYFVLLAGRLVFLPVELKDYDYTIYQKCIELE